MCALSRRREMYLDSCYLRHMMGNQHLFVSLSKTQGGTITFGDDEDGGIVGTGNIDKSPSIILEDVLFVDGLKANLVSISQLCNKDLDVTFKCTKCLIVNSDSKIVFEVSRDRNVYTFELNDLTRAH